MTNFGWHYPPGMRESDIPGWNTRDEEVVEIPSACESCDWEGLAEVFEGEYETACPSCNKWALVRA